MAKIQRHALVCNAQKMSGRCSLVNTILAQELMPATSLEQSSALRWLHRKPDGPGELWGFPFIIVVRIARSENGSSTR